MAHDRKPQAAEDLIITYLSHWGGFCRALKKRVGSQELAEDALQETWFRLEKSKPSDVIDDKKAYILRIAGNIAIDLLRREQRHTSRCLSDENLLAAVEDIKPSPEIVAIDRDELRHLVLVLMQLPEKPRLALLYNRCDGLTHAEIAAKLCVSASMVARYLSQALRHCRDHFHGR